MFKGKTAIITGGGRGIGYAIAEKLADNGCNVALLEIGEYVHKSAEQLSAKGIKAKGVICDISKFDSCKAAVEEVVKEFGRVDFLVNNAGVIRDTLLMRMKEEDWDLVINVNLKGVFNMTKAVIPGMMKAQSGKIVNISSVSGLMGAPGQANYSSAKAGVIGLTKSNSKEFGSRNITVNAICPGFIQTDMTADLKDEWKEGIIKQTPLGRAGTPNDIAGAVKFFLSPDADWITGVILRVDGGMAAGA